MRRRPNYPRFDWFTRYFHAKSLRPNHIFHLHTPNPYVIFISLILSLPFYIHTLFHLCSDRCHKDQHYVLESVIFEGMILDLIS